MTNEKDIESKIRALATEIDVYHYTNQDHFSLIQNMGIIPSSDLGCAVLSKLDERYQIEFPKETYSKVWFGILPEHKKFWTENEKFPWIWDSLMENVIAHSGTDLDKGEVYEINLRVPVDNLFVFDYSPIAKVEHVSLLRLGMNRLLEATQKYWSSKIPFSDYSGQHIIPEIVSWFPVSPEQVSLKSKNLYEIQYLPKPTMPEFDD